MTAIVAVQYEGGAAIGLDSWTEWGNVGLRNASKFIHRWQPRMPGDTDLLIATAGHASLNSFLEEWEPPMECTPQSVTKALREEIMDTSWFPLVKDKDDAGIEGDFLCALGDQIWSTGGTFSMLTPKGCDYLASGCGESFVFGAMWATQGLFLDDEMGWLSRINLALAAAENHCPGVRGPFMVRTTSGEEY